MRHSQFPRTAALCFGIPAAALFLAAQTPAVPPEVQGLPPRAAPTDYQAQGKPGALAIGAEFSDHSVPTADLLLTNPDYVVVELGLYGAPGARLVLSPEDFSLRINGKKAPLPAQPYALVLKSLKDPTWEPPAPPEGSKSKTKLGSGLGQSENADPIRPVHPPFELQRSWAKRAEKAALPEGDRPLPQAGLLFFEYGGKVKSAELIYNGPAGKATITLQP